MTRRPDEDVRTRGDYGIPPVRARISTTVLESSVVGPEEGHTVSWCCFY